VGERIREHGIDCDLRWGFCELANTPAQFAEYSAYARVFGLAASCGSDYHGPGEGWLDLGDLPDMPAGVTPIWTRW